MEGDVQKQLRVAMEYLETLANEDPEVLKKKMYESLSGISFLIVEAKHAKFKRGWASKLLDRHNEPLFDKKEVRIIEDGIELFVRPLFEDAQKGGMKLPKKLYNSGTPSLFKTASELKPHSIAEEISLDKTSWKISNFFKNMDDRVKKLTREYGPFRFFYNKDIDFRVPIPIPSPLPPYVVIGFVPLNRRAVPIIITLVLEAIRIINGTGPLSTDFARKILSLILGLVELLKGDWIQSILTLLGFFGESPLVAGLVVKTFVNVLGMVAPDLGIELAASAYKSGKSIFIGFFLWAFANFAPHAARSVVRKQFDQIRKVTENINKESEKMSETVSRTLDATTSRLPQMGGDANIEKIQGAMEASIASKGFHIKFGEIPEDYIPTFDDIQRLQIIIREPTIVCSNEFQEVIRPLFKVPVFRLILELMSIPTDPQTLQADCGNKAGKPMDKTITDVLIPTQSDQSMAVPADPGNILPSVDTTPLENSSTPGATPGATSGATPGAADPPPSKPPPSKPPPSAKKRGGARKSRNTRRKD